VHLKAQKILNISREYLSSAPVWRLSGVTYASAVLATRGALLTPADYVDRSRFQMKRLPIIWSDSRVLEFGCGLGGNLLAVSSAIREGVGVDINPGYLRIARALCRASRVNNLQFDEINAPLEDRVGNFDVVLSIGVFERIPKARVAQCVSDLVGLTRAGGDLALYFLSTLARGTDFTRLLGGAAYQYWPQEEVLGLVRSVGCRIRSVIDWPSADHHTADMYVISKS